MGRQAHTKFTVNGSEYAVGAMPPIDACRFGMEVGAAIMPALTALGAAFQGGMTAVLGALQGVNIDPAKLTAAIEQARQYLILPDNKFGRDTGAFEAWFNEHPGDLYEVSLLAVWHLLSDFMPPSLRTAAIKIGSSAGKASQSSPQTA